MNPPNKPQRYIIIDSCIFKLLSKPDVSKQILELLADSIAKGYAPGISMATLFELIDTSTVDNELAAGEAVKDMKHFEVDKGVLIAAGHIGCLYQGDGIEIKKVPDIGDKIIAATAYLNDAIIFTINGRDFPAPFFNIINKPLLKYKQSDGREVCVISYFLEPDIDLIKMKYQERMEEHKLKGSKKNKQ